MFGVLNVYLKSRFCGQLSWESERNRYEFRYDRTYLEDDSQAERLSFSLPLQAEPFDEDRSYRYFANLLPPEVVRRKLEKCLHVSRNNVFGFLKAIGGDCAGAVALYPPGARPAPDGEERLRELGETEAAEILKALKRRPLYAAGEEGYRYSAAGAQDKLVVRLKDGKLEAKGEVFEATAQHGFPFRDLVELALFSQIGDLRLNEFIGIFQAIGIIHGKLSIQLNGCTALVHLIDLTLNVVNGHQTDKKVHDQRHAKQNQNRISNSL